MKKISFLFFCVVIVFLPFMSILGNILEFKTILSSSQIFWITHWYEPVLVVSFLFLVLGFFWQRNTVKKTSQLLALILITFGVISAVFISPSIGRGLEGFRFTLLSLLFFILASSFDSETKKKFFPSLTTCYVLLATVIALWAIIERSLPIKYWNNIGLIDPRIIFGWGWHGAGGFLQSTSFLGGPNQLASYLLPALFIVVLSKIQDTRYKIQTNSKFQILNSKSHTTCYILLATIIALAIILTQSRSAIIGLIVGLLVYVYFINKNRILKYSSSVLFLISAMVLFFLYQTNINFKTIITHGGQTGHQSALINSIKEIKNRTTQNPAKLIFGSGLGTAGPLVIKYGNGFISESWYLQLFLEIGLAGLILWFWFIVSLLKELWQEESKGMFLGLLAVSVTAIFLHTWADNPAMSYTLFILLGITKGEIWQKKY